MTEAERIAKGLSPRDTRLLERLIKTNGGGVYYELIPKAQLKRMIGLGLAAYKPVNAKRNENIAGLQYGQIIHGPLGLEVRSILQGEQP
jgi:hypothetical protein